MLVVDTSSLSSTSTSSSISSSSSSPSSRSSSLVAHSGALSAIGVSPPECSGRISGTAVGGGDFEVCWRVALPVEVSSVAAGSSP